MSIKPSSPAQLARLEKQKIASTEGAKAISDQHASAIAVRKNMERLRALRLAKEAEDAASAPSGTLPAKKKVTAGKSAKAKAAAKSGAKSEPLSQWLATQKDTGRAS